MSASPENTESVDTAIQHALEWSGELNHSIDTEPQLPMRESDSERSMRDISFLKTSDVIKSTNLKSFYEVSKRLDHELRVLMDDVEKIQKVPAYGSAQLINVPIESLRPNARNPRRYTDNDLDELAASIRERGIIQPIIVRSADSLVCQYEIVVGERRWRAAQRAGLHEVPVAVRAVSDVESLELAIIENIQRTDLNALEEALAYRTLAERHGHSQDEIAKIVGKSRSHIANTLRLLKLSDQVKEYVHLGKLSAGHARMLVGHPDAEELAREIIERGLNVREVEAVAQATTDCARKRAKTRANAQRDTYLLMLEKRLSDLFGLELSIEPRGEKGVLRICYTGLEQLDNIAQQLERSQQKGRSDTSAEDESTSMGTEPGGLRGEYPAH